MRKILLTGNLLLILSLCGCYVAPPPPAYAPPPPPAAYYYGGPAVYGPPVSLGIGIRR